MAQDEIYAATASVLAILRDPRTTDADALDVLRKSISSAYHTGRVDGAAECAKGIMTAFDKLKVRDI